MAFNNMLLQAKKLFPSLLRQHSLFGKERLKNPSLQASIAASIGESKTVALLYFDIVGFHEVEQINDPGITLRVLSMFKRALESEIPQVIGYGRLLGVENLWGDDFVAFLALEKSPHFPVLQELAFACRVAVCDKIKKDIQRIAGKALEVHVGYALVENKLSNLEISLYRAVREAQEIAKGKTDLEIAQLLFDFKEILNRELINVVYQPIVSLQSGSLLGWEALARGPQETYFQNPLVIFTFAEKAGLLFPLEKLCRKKALQHIGQLAEGQKLFLNINPHTINDPHFARGETLKMIQETGLTPKNIVFEITERQSIDNYLSLNRTLEHYRNQGFLVAVDDAGSGFSSLQSIAELRPDFIKIDMSLVQGINTNPAKRALLEIMVSFAEKFNSFVIAEGIEDEEVLKTLIQIGVHFGQGYYLGRPAFPPSPPVNEAFARLLALTSTGRANIFKHAFPIRDIAENAPTVLQRTHVWRVKEIFDSNDDLQGVVVVDEGKPVGLVMRNQLNSHLGTQYGASLYLNKEIGILMDHAPLIVSADMSIETVSHLAMGRKKSKLYDFVLLIDKSGFYYGVVSVQNLLDTLTRLRLEMARGANPLTGLPGNIAIEQRFEELKAAKASFSFIYIDLDNFKAYNDHYGFEQGNEIIVFTAKLLSSVVNKYGSREKDFVGHIGGDDFVLIVTDTEKVDLLCSRTVSYFDRLIKRYYDPEARKQGGIYGYPRGECGEGSCQARLFPFISISMAIIDYDKIKGADLRSIAEKAAQLKCYAKSIPGSAFVRDRRGEAVSSLAD